MIAKLAKGISTALATSTLFVSCTTTITKLKSPEFTVAADTLQAHLNNMVACENFNLDGREVTTSGKIATELEIDVMNGKNVPADDGRMKDLGKAIASYLKNSLKDPKEYDNYKVLFITKVTKGALTERNWTGAFFKLEEL